MPRRKSVPQVRTMSEVDDGLRRVYAEYKQQLAIKDAEIDRINNLFNELQAVRRAIAVRMDAVEEALSHKVFNGNL